MKLKNLHVDGFGVWTELDLQSLSHRVTIVFGANETGKTTLMQFIRTMLYGFSPERRGRYLPPVHGGRAGGTLDVDASHGDLRIGRYLDRLGLPDEEEDVAVHAADGAKLSVSLLGHLLNGVDEPTFNNVFSVGLRELQELGTLDDTKAADLLYKLTTGLDRVSLIDVMRNLREVRESLYDPRNDTSRIPVLVDRRAQLQQRIDALKSDGQQWIELQSQLVSLDDEARELNQRADLGQEELRVLDVALRVHDTWRERKALEQQLEAIGPLREVPPTSLKRLQELRKEAEEYEREVASLQQRRREFRREVAAQPINRALWSESVHIEALVELAPWIASLQADVDQTRTETGSLETRLTAAVNQLGVRDAKGQQALPELSPRVLASLQRHARAVREETQRLKSAQAEQDAAQRQVDELAAELEAAMQDRGQKRLTEAVEAAGVTVTHLRRRAQLDTRLDQLTHQWDQVQEEHRDVLEAQVPTPTTLAWLGVPFVVGIAFLVGGFVWHQAAMLGWPMALLGLFGTVAAIVGKMTMERTAAQELEDCESQMKTLRSQISQMKKERADLDAQLPRGNGPWEVRLAAAEKNLAELEALLPLEANLQASRQRALTAQRAAEQVETAAKQARARWRTGLRELNLPDDLSPLAVKQLADGTQQVIRSRHDLENRREELSARQRELASLTKRVSLLVEKVQLPYSSPDPQVQLQRLAAALAEQRTLYERRQQLRQEDRQTRRQVRQLTGELKKSRAERRTIMTAAGVSTEPQLRELLARLAQRRTLADRLRSVTEQYTTALGKDSPVERVETVLASRTQAELEQQRSDLARQVGEARSQLSHLHQRRGAMLQQSQGLVGDRRLPELKLQLGCVTHELHEAVQRWRVLSLVADVLEVVREVYETQRQPQTLRDASRYFAMLTEGQYVRIWTPLTDMSLRVDLASGESLGLDVLSSGTREAVFLSLRLALVADFTRRGINLPLILDDVLVNFDRRRARAAADVLCDFAQHGHQVLLFTCHEHIVALFAARDVQVRCLSDLLRAAEPALEIPTPAIKEKVEPRRAEPAPTPIDEEVYKLGDVEHVLAAPPLNYLLNPAVDQAEVDTDLDDEPFEDVAVCAEEKACEPAVEPAEHALPDPTPHTRTPMQQRFTWESPERWWNSDRNNEAA